MKTIKKAIRIFTIVCLIILAGMGLGLSGGVPIPKNNRRNDKTEFKNELKSGDQMKKLTAQK